MANIILRGTKLPQLQRQVESSSPTTGFLTTYEFNGAGQDEARAVYNDFILNGIECRLILEHGKAFVEATDATAQFTLDTWQILGNEESRDGLSHPTVMRIIGEDQDMAAALRTGIDSPPGAGGQSVSNIIDKILAGGDFADLSEGDTAILGRFLGLNFRGSPDYQRQQYVLRHTTNVSNRFLGNIDDFNIDSIYSTASLLSECQSTSLWTLPLPARMANKINLIPSPTPRDNYFFGWKKGASTETNAANNRIDITTEFVLEQWSTDYYPNTL